MSGWRMLLSVMITAGWVASAWSQEAPWVDEIVRKANHVSYYQGSDGRADVQMSIKDAQGHERTRQFTILRRNDGPAGVDGPQKFFVYFHRPADVNRMVFVVWKPLEKDDDRWLYLPALDLVKRIAASDKRTSFVGSDFCYEDVSGRQITLDTHTLSETTTNYYVLDNVPKDPQSVEFASYKMWVHRGTFLPVKVEYFDRGGQKYREYSALKVETIQDFPTVTRSVMKDLKSGGETVVEYGNVKYDVGLPAGIFTEVERYVRRPPMEFLK